MNSVSLPACAKVNLHLAVLGRRPDGYHELLTLFERISLADEVIVEAISAGEVEFRCDSPELPLDGTNLAVRAAEAFRQVSGWKKGVRIRLKKRVPVGGGLGGGSSDAAAVLTALQRLSGQALPPERLMDCARALGADVAFFAAQVSWAVGRDRGDRIEPVPLKAKLWHLLVTPDFQIPTRQVYRAFRPSMESKPGLTPSPADVTLLLRALEDRQVVQARELLFNALEPTVESLYPAIRLVKTAMEKPGGLVRPCVSGSGSTVFALCESEVEAQAAAGRIRAQQPAWTVTVASTI